MNNYIYTSNAYIKEKPTNDSETISEAFFSEEIEVLNSNLEWAEIKTKDNCRGFVKANTIYSTPSPFFQQSDKILRVKQYHAAHIYNTPDTIYGPVLTIPFESRLKLLDEYSERWLKVILYDGREAFIQRGDVEFEPKILNKLEMCRFSYNFLGLPYTWGGRSSFGYDCSGFTQMLYRQMNLHLPRNAREQILWSNFKDTTEENLKSGDLIFFGPNEAKITHVGLYITNNSFIHACVLENKPYVRTSKLSDHEWNGKTRFRCFKTLC